MIMWGAHREWKMEIRIGRRTVTGPFASVSLTGFRREGVTFSWVVGS